MNKEKSTELNVGKIIDFNHMIFAPEFYAWDCVGFETALTPAHQKGFENVGIDYKDLGLTECDFENGDKQIIQKYTQFCMQNECIDNDGKLTPENMYFNARYALFISVDNGVSWVYGGIPIGPTKSDPNAPDSGVIWSGSFLPDDKGNVLGAYTGVPQNSPKGVKNKLSKYVLQNSMGATSDDGGFTFKKIKTPLVSAVRDYDQLKEAGYYLGKKSMLGAENDPDGTHMTQRDMQLVKKRDGSLWGFFAAKAVSKEHKTGVEPCICQVEFNSPDSLEEGIKRIGLPIMLPSGIDGAFNQLECPNVVFNDQGDFIVIASLAQHWKIGQAERSAVKVVKAYKVNELSNGCLGNLIPYGNPEKGENILLTNKEHGLYALCVLKNNNKPGEYDCAAFQVKEDHKFQLPSMKVNVNGEKPTIKIPDLNYYRNLVKNVLRDTKNKLC